MTLQQYKQANLERLESDWAHGECDEYSSFEAFCWSQWQHDGDCSYE